MQLQLQQLNLMPRKKSAIVAGRFRLVKISEAPPDTIHLQFVPPDIVQNPLAELKFAQALPFGVLIPVPADFAKKFTLMKVYSLSLREEN
jgi:hypothetical protein